MMGIDRTEVKSQPFAVSGKFNGGQVCNRVFCSWRPGTILFVASGVVLLAALVWFRASQLPPNPVYGGKKLSVWLQTYAPSGSAGKGSLEWSKTDDAVRHIGTNCIPMLLHLLREKDSHLELELIALAQRQRLIKTHFVPAAERNTEASMAFLALGDTARDAVPRLMEIYGENNSVESRCAVEDAFGWIGPAAKPALPLLFQATTNSNNRIRADALWALGEIHAEPQSCVPRLVRALSDSDEQARLSAAHALGMFGSDAQSAVPSLIALWNPFTSRGRFSFMAYQVQWEAKRALEKINPRVV